MNRVTSRLFFALTLLATGPLATSNGLPAQDAPLQDLDDYVQAAMKDWQVPGLSIAVIKKDKIVYAKGFGIREIGKPDKVDERTVFAIASNSKAFTCAALGMIKDEGKLSWNDKVTDLLPWFHLHDAQATADLRVIDLVTHRIGLPTFGGDHLWIGSPYKRREILARIRHQKLTAPFRTSFQYQNIMYTAAGEIIPAKTGKTWSEFVQERILQPLGMKDTTTSMGDLKKQDNVATPHEIRGGKLTTMEFDNVDAVAAAAAINSNVVDVAQWLRLNLAGGKFGGKQLISPRVMQEMTTLYNSLPRPVGYERVQDEHFRGYGLGWFVNDYKGRKVIAHGGGLTGMISRTTWIPEEQLGVVVLTNMAENSLPTALTRWIVDRFLGAKDRDWNQLYLGAKKRREQRVAAMEKRLQGSRIRDTRPSLALEAYTGKYNNPLPGDATVSLKDGKLYFYYNRRHHGHLSHWHHDTFRIVWINNIMDMQAKAFLRFELNDQSKVVKLHTRWYRPITFDKK